MPKTPVKALLLTLAAISILSAQSTPIPGKFYEYYAVANTQGGAFTALGEPSINDNGLCAFMGQTSIGQTLWTSDGNMHPPVDINPGSGNPGTVFFNQQLQINNNNQVIAEDTLGSAQNVRLWNANATDSYTYVARAGSGQQYTALYGAPTLNKTSNAVYAAIQGTTTSLYEAISGKKSSFGINTSTPQPVVANNGSIVITTTSHETGLNEITLFTSGFASEVDIADGNNFSYLDTAPGLSADGNIVVFEGTLTSVGAGTLGLTAGPGIFAAVNTGSAWQVIRVTGLMVEAPNDAGGNHNGVCDPGETCINAAELGYDDNNNPVYFSSYPTNSRVAVVNPGFGASGIANDSFVISFVGTPNHASRTNPVLGNFPLLFSSQTGLWTIRVDAENQLSPPKAMVFHPYTAIPVVQINDQVGPGNIIASIGVNMSIGNAAQTETGTARTMRRGDHRIAFLATTTTGAQIIYRANHLDSDQDGLLDHWETTGIDMNQDGVIDLNLAAMGANPNVRDLFVEMDWLADTAAFSFQPAPGVITAVGGGAGYLPSMLNSAPALTGTMYGALSNGGTPASIPAGIVMHIDGGHGTDKQGGAFTYNMGTGPLDGGQQIGLTGGGNTGLIDVLYYGAPQSINIPGIGTRAFQDAKNYFFGSQDKDGRELAFKYAILADHFVFVDNPPAAHPVSSAGSYSATQSYFIEGDAFPAGLTNDFFVKIASGTGAGQVHQIYGFSQTVAGQVIVSGIFNPLPDTTSKVVYLDSSGGNSELFINNAPDYNSLPGNDFLLALGDWGTNPAGYLMDACTQWRTIAHELGHTLGLRHGGIDNETEKGNAYLSLMSYSWQLSCAANATVQGYSGATDPTFNDFANLNHNFAEVFFHEGNTLGTAYGSGPEQTGTTPEQGIQEYINQNGPVTFSTPTVAITSPANNSQIGIGGPLTAAITATDATPISTVRATFDANGNGVIDPTEIVAAKSAGANTYHASYAAITGNPGARTLTAIAVDSKGNASTVTSTINVVTANAAPDLVSLSPSSATHGGANLLVTITGTGFVSGCYGEWNGAQRKTTFVSSTQIQMTVLSTDIVNAGTAQITAVNPAQGSGKSNSLTFTVN